MRVFANDAETVPVIDLTADARTVASEIASACRHWGIFRVVGHGFSPALLKGCLDQTKRFFALPAATRRSLSRTRHNPWGFYDRELTKNARDKKEIFDIGPDRCGASNGSGPFTGTTPWPDDWPAFRADMRSYFEACEALSRRLLRDIALELNDTEGVTMGHFSPNPTSYLRLNHYPVADPLNEKRDHEDGLGVHEHTDAGALTILLEDGVPGLQIFRRGRWIDAGCYPGTLTINIGDMIQVLSNDSYRAPVHRVVGMTNADRYSVPFFFNPRYGAVIEPLGSAVEPGAVENYNPVSWSEFRRARADGDYGNFGHETQIADYRKRGGQVRPS